MLTLHKAAALLCTLYTSIRLSAAKREERFIRGKRFLERKELFLLQCPPSKDGIINASSSNPPAALFEHQSRNLKMFPLFCVNSSFSLDAFSSFPSASA